ncbi:MAG TPA: carbamate kinase [Myxococcota bacterium]|nr:carbamate kinase [Myxococcota bacterium]HRY96264.1 carbamate kinase [Myxococcota bacterium]HSA20444.1 carbamate kinase [Myxococcota bacterium]
MGAEKKSKLVVLAIGGNSLIRDKDHQSVEDQFEVTRETCKHIREMIELGWTVVVTHGNGPQVGFILRRSELSVQELHPVPLPSIGADTQGAIGYMIQQCLANELRAAGLVRPVVTVVTQVLVDRDDPAFQKPSKPIGSFMDEAQALKHKAKDGWDVREDAGRGWRRVVASPLPREILELDAVRLLVDAGVVVIAVGGGGIPVIRNAAGDLEGVPAVIDKDYASALLANQLRADRFIISTAVERVCLNYNKPDQRALPSLTLGEARRLLQAGQFPAGSMGPKIQAVASYLEAGGQEAIITSPEFLAKALQGEAGTKILPG